MRKNKNKESQYLYATESVQKFSYKTAKSFFSDVKKMNKKGSFAEKGIKQRISRTEKLLKEAISFKGSRKEKQAKQQKFMKSFQGLADKEFFEYDKKNNTLTRRFVLKREWIDGKKHYSRTQRFKVGRKKSYKFSGEVFDYETFKESFASLPENEKQKIYNHQEAFVSGRYSRWTVAIKSILGIDASISPARLDRWITWFQRGKEVDDED